MAQILEAGQICGECFRDFGIITYIIEEKEEGVFKKHIHNDEFVKQIETKLKIVETLEEPEHLNDKIWFQDMMD